MSEVGAPGAGAPAPAPAAEPASVPIDQTGPQHPNPVTSTPTPDKSEVSRGQPPSAKEKLSIDEAIKKAHAEVTAKEAKPKAEPKAEAKPPPAKPEAKDEPAKASPRERGEDGRFASAHPSEEPAAASPDPNQPDHSQPPRHYNFSPEATADWVKTPDTVKGEFDRRYREIENGLHKYRADAEAYQPLKRWDELARQTGTTADKAMENYVSVERQLASDDPAEKWEGIQRVLKRANIDPRQLASAILNQPLPTVDQQVIEQRQAYAALERKLAAIEQTQQQQIQRQQFSETNSVVTGFARERPRFNELSDTIAGYLNGQNERGIHIDPQRRLPADQRLQQAYDLAEQLSPSAASPRAPLVPEPARPANGAGMKSIAGSPANGSDPRSPAIKGQKPSIDESIRRAAARMNLS